MRFIVDLFIGFLSIGFVEAVVKPVAARFVRRQIEAVAPAVLEEIDRCLPELLLSGGRETIESFAKDMLESELKRNVQQGEIDALFQILDVRIAADRLLKG